MKIRRSEDRGKFDLPWLKAKHSFSFGHYYDSENMGFRSLRVINEDIISPLGGFDTHPHKEMEIISFIIEGQLSHKDSLGNDKVISPGMIQVMSAGRGILHSEHNAQVDKHTHMLQIWIQPRESNLRASYSEYKYEQDKGLSLIASGNEQDSVAKINSDVEVYLLDSDEEFSFDDMNDYWIQVISGEFEVSSNNLKAGDGASFSSESFSAKASSDKPSKALIFKFL